MYVLLQCLGSDGTVARSAIARVDLADRRLSMVHSVPVNQFPKLTVLDRRQAPLFVIADIAVVGQEKVTVFDPSKNWKSTELPGLIGLPG